MTKNKTLNKRRTSKPVAHNRIKKDVFLDDKAREQREAVMHINPDSRHIKDHSVPDKPFTE